LAKDLNSSDEKPPKLTARKMLKMALAINQKHFDGKDRMTSTSAIAERPSRGRPSPPAPRRRQAAAAQALR